MSAGVAPPFLRHLPSESAKTTPGIAPGPAGLAQEGHGEEPGPGQPAFRHLRARILSPEPYVFLLKSIPYKAVQ